MKYGDKNLPEGCRQATKEAEICKNQIKALPLQRICKNDR